MKNVILASIVAGILAVLLAGPAAAQNANGNANTGANAASDFTVKNVDPVHPFGSINHLQCRRWSSAGFCLGENALSGNRSRRRNGVGRCSSDPFRTSRTIIRKRPISRQNFAIAIAGKWQHRSVNESAEGIAGSAAGLRPPASVMPGRGPPAEWRRQHCGPSLRLPAERMGRNGVPLRLRESRRSSWRYPSPAAGVLEPISFDTDEEIYRQHRPRSWRRCINPE